MHQVSQAARRRMMEYQQPLRSMPLTIPCDCTPESIHTVRTERRRRWGRFWKRITSRLTKRLVTSRAECLPCCPSCRGHYGSGP